jgi:phosphodiesterase/alkaline phosphatase D-like protein
VAAVRDANPQIAYADSSRRGYVMVEAGRERLEARFRVLEDVARPDSTISTAASFTVLAGRPGLSK